MSNKVLLNESHSVNYLIHGQNLDLSFSFKDAFFVIIYYNQVPSIAKFKKGTFWFFKRLFFYKNEGVFKSAVNIYRPEIKIYTIGWKFRNLTIPLKIDKVTIDQKQPKIIVHTPKVQQIQMNKVVINSYKRISVPITDKLNYTLKNNSFKTTHSLSNELDELLIQTIK